MPENKNFPVVHEGSTYWISRAVAVTGFIFARQNSKTFILANKRGQGTPNFKGYWNAPCGYLDFNESTREACVREIFEETGIRIDPEALKFDSISEDPYNAQNITFKYYFCFDLDYDAMLPQFSGANCEENEVDDIAWIEMHRLANYSWAFNHLSNIRRIYKTRIRTVARIINFFFPRFYTRHGWPSMNY